MARRKGKYTVAVIDFETDPFLFGRIPQPFCLEFHTKEKTMAWWGKPQEIVEAFIEFLEEENASGKHYLIYAHNGGKFDFHFLHGYIDNPALIIKNRIVEAFIRGHKIRDSFAILPFPLKAYDKIEFDYEKMEADVREQHKDEILEYLHYDCLKLYELVSAFVERFGPRLTIGGTAMKEIQKFHEYNKQGSRHDESFRPFYFGGRVQCFQAGILKGPWKLYDVNSMYPSVMRNQRHPINGTFDIMRGEMPDNFEQPFFIHFTGKNWGALPSKDEEGGLIFTKTHGDFYACSHELEIALKYKLIEIDEIHICYVAQTSISFKEFVDYFFEEKANAKASGDAITELFAKYILNSGYGRFGINPANFEDWVIHRDFGNEDELEADGYSQKVDYDEIELWSRPTEVREDQFCDVSVAASITSAARAILLEGLQNAEEPIYCDTDSIMCREFRGDIDRFRLGAWDLEKTADFAAIAGKKLYALYNKDGSKVKLSSKGGTLNVDQIRAICRGEIVTYNNMAPSFSLRRAPDPVKSFVTRRFSQTAQTAQMGKMAFLLESHELPLSLDGDEIGEYQ
jgi:hypothetical protein